MILEISSRSTINAVALVCLGLMGCGEQSELVPVGGRALYKGQPAIGARLHFLRRNPQPSAPMGPIPTAMVDDQGTFAVSTGDLGRGLPAGRYAVLVHWPEESSAPRPAQRGRPGVEARSKLNRTPLDRLKGRYMDVSAPRIFADVTPDSGELPTFDLID